MIAENLNKIKQEVPDHVQLVVVSKFRSMEALQEVYDLGYRDFAENRVQELSRKQELMPNDVRWHMIGHLQRNKVKYIIPFIHMIHSVDSAALAESIEKESAKSGRVIPCLLQVHIAQEESKFGFSEDELNAFLRDRAFVDFPHIAWKGLMGMATLTGDKTQVKKEFDDLARMQKNVIAQFPDASSLTELSMGMSGDYPIAIESGSTMLRLGSIVFEP